MILTCFSAYSCRLGPWAWSARLSSSWHCARRPRSRGCTSCRVHDRSACPLLLLRCRTWRRFRFCGLVPFDWFWFDLNIYLVHNIVNDEVFVDSIIIWNFWTSSTFFTWSRSIAFMSLCRRLTCWWLFPQSCLFLCWRWPLLQSWSGVFTWWRVWRQVVHRGLSLYWCLMHSFHRTTWIL